MLTNTKDATTYWRKLKQRLKTEGNETVTNCHALKMKAPDGKMRKTDCASTEQLLRLIQSIPSKKAEPFKLWLAEVSATALSQAKNPKGFQESRSVTQEGGTIAGNARRELEEKLGKSVISPLNAYNPALLDDPEREKQHLFCKSALRCCF